MSDDNREFSTARLNIIATLMDAQSRIELRAWKLGRTPTKAERIAVLTEQTRLPLAGIEAIVDALDALFDAVTPDDCERAAAPRSTAEIINFAAAGEPRVPS